MNDKQHTIQAGTEAAAVKFVWLSAFLLLALFLLAAAAPGASAQQTVRAAHDWTGDYTFTDVPKAPARRSQTAVAPEAVYEIRIEKGAGGKLVGKFSATGVQLYDTYECLVKLISDERAEFRFQRVGEKDAPNLYDFKTGDLLFMIERTDKATKYLFKSAGYKIVRITTVGRKAPPRASVYFVKQ